MDTKLLSSQGHASEFYNAGVLCLPLTLPERLLRKNLLLPSRIKNTNWNHKNPRTIILSKCYDTLICPIQHISLVLKYSDEFTANTLNLWPYDLISSKRVPICQHKADMKWSRPGLSRPVSISIFSRTWRLLNKTVE